MIKIQYAWANSTHALLLLRLKKEFKLIAEYLNNSKEQKQPNKNTSYEFNETFSIKKSHKKKKENCEDTLSEIEEKLLIELGKYPREKYIKYKKEIMMIMRVEVVPEMKERCPLIIWDHVIFLKYLCSNS